jgi:branched-chain amino acid transport system ATP-binding protein
MVEIQNVSFSYGTIRALNNVSLRINDGELVTLIGSNGAGKTTMLCLLSGLYTPSEGHILLDGQDVAALPAHKHVALGIIHVPEGRQIFAKMTIEENLRLGGYLVRDGAEYRRRADEVMTLFPLLSERRKQSAGSLSGGEQQMLAIARALISKPKVLLLDEPSLGLSPVMTQQVFAVIENLKAQGITILLVEQNAAEALQISDRAYILETGKITMEGASKDFINNKAIQEAYLGLGDSNDD